MLHIENSGMRYGLCLADIEKNWSIDQIFKKLLVNHLHDIVDITLDGRTHKLLVLTGNKNYVEDIIDFAKKNNIRTFHGQYIWSTV